MRTAKKTISPTRLACLSCVGILTVLLAAPGSALAAGPKWSMKSLASTSAAPGEELEYIFQGSNVGGEPTDGSQIEYKAALPAGMSAAGGSKLYLNGTEIGGGESVNCTAGNGTPLPSATDPQHVKCLTTHPVGSEPTPSPDFQFVRLNVKVASGVQEGSVLTPAFEVSGGGGGSASTINPTRISASPPPFGIDAFDNEILEAGGEASKQAGAHPFGLLTSIDFNTRTDFSLFTTANTIGTIATPIEPLKDTILDLPPGFVGNTTHLGTCKAIDFLAVGGGNCPSSSQIGNVVLGTNNFAIGSSAAFGPFPLYNLEAPVGTAARFGFAVAQVGVILDASVRSDGDYGISAGSLNASGGISVGDISVEFWGEPASAARDDERICLGNAAQRCPGGDQVPFFRNPTSCDGPVTSALRIDSYFQPGVSAEKSVLSHETPGYPLPEGPSTFPAGYSGPTERGAPYGFEGCEAEPFEPSLEAGPPTGSPAAQPSSFDFTLNFPQEGLEEPGAISESDLRNIEITLPKGVRVNPSSADGLGSCSPAQVAMTTPVGQADAHFETAKTACPENSKIGSVAIKTPLLAHEVAGAAYLAQPEQNPFGSLLAIYLVIHDEQSGVNIVLPGQIHTDPNTGQITTTFNGEPQLPFGELHLDLKSGPRAPLTTPDSCGTYTTHTVFTGWSGKVTEGNSSFTIDHGCPAGTFAPRLDAGVQNPLAGAFSPFSLRLSREDGSQEISSLTATLPPGLLGKLKGVTYCPEPAIAALKAAEGTLDTAAAQVAAPSCPASSQVGMITVGAGSGPTPFFTNLGRLYLAGPYKGSPYSLVAIVPALAGPFDLGTVVVRNTVDLDHETTAIKVGSDPFPRILDGIPLDIRDLRVEVNRPEFTVNPTDCEPLAVGSTVSATTGTGASLSQRFQVSGCERLGFKPKLTLRLKGKVNRTAHPSLIANLKGRPGDANIARAQVKLPPAAFLDNAHIGGVCTRVQFAAQQCPANSVYGKATATTPLLNYPLSGPVYLRTNPEHELPDLVVALRGSYGERIEVDLAGRTDSVKGALRNTFEVVPDAAVGSFHLQLFGGKRGLIEMSDGFCAHPNATVNLDAQNGRSYDTTPQVAAKCGKSGDKRHSRR
jgi:hypothetical protein